MNEYFEYNDFAVGAKDNCTFTFNKTLQKLSNVNDLLSGVTPQDYLSLEKNEYVTKTPKKLLKNGKIGLLTSDVSNENGIFTAANILTCSFNGYYTMTGITLSSRNIIQSITITAYRDDEVILTKSFTATDYIYFYDFEVETVNKIVIQIDKIDKAFHFFGLYNIEFGKIRIFDNSVIANSEINNYFSLVGDTLQYDTLDLTINKDADTEYLFQRKQPLNYYYNSVLTNKFYIEKGDENDNNTIKITAYDNVSNLEDEFLGGIYSNYKFNDLLKDILSIGYVSNVSDTVVINGYIPITTKRKALQMICLASNVRLYKTSVFTFDTISFENIGIFDETNIIENPKTTKKQIVKSITAVQHNYSKITDVEELYHWYIAQNKNIMLKFNSPHHDYKAYEVTGIDENGNDIVSAEESTNIIFVKKEANYIVIQNSSSNKIVIKAEKYTDSTVNYTKISQYVSSNEIYTEEKIDDLTVYCDEQAMVDLLFSIYQRKNSVNFQSIIRPEIGKQYDVLSNNLNVTKITHSIYDIFELEAE